LLNQLFSNTRIFFFIIIIIQDLSTWLKITYLIKWPVGIEFPSDMDA